MAYQMRGIESCSSTRSPSRSVALDSFEQRRLSATDRIEAQFLRRNLGADSIFGGDFSLHPDSRDSIRHEVAPMGE